MIKIFISDSPNIEPKKVKKINYISGSLYIFDNMNNMIILLCNNIIIKQVINYTSLEMKLFMQN